MVKNTAARALRVLWHQCFSSSNLTTITHSLFRFSISVTQVSHCESIVIVLHVQTPIVKY